MRTFSVGAMLSLAVALGAAAQAGAPINAKCPIKGTPVKPNITTTYMGKVIGFC
jgi:hypothetical protein